MCRPSPPSTWAILPISFPACRSISVNSASSGDAGLGDGAVSHSQYPRLPSVICEIRHRHAWTSQ
jgi:hypothetical protein